MTSEFDKKNILVLFDVDGTLTCKDTFFLFLRYAGGIRFYALLPVLCVIYFLFRIGLLSAQKSKEGILCCVFGGLSQVYLEQKAKKFVKYLLDNKSKFFRKNALETVAKYTQDSRVILVSASPELWITPLAEILNVGCIATKLSFIDGTFSGKISGENCNGIEKVKRIQEYIPCYQNYCIVAYGDSEGDKAMLSLAQEAFYKPFR